MRSLRFGGRALLPDAEERDDSQDANRSRVGPPSVKVPGLPQAVLVLTNTIMHRTKVPIRTWLFVLFEMSAGKNGMALARLTQVPRLLVLRGI
jgi:hypothetical protein